MLRPERRALLDSLIAEGTAIQDMHRVHGFNYRTVRKYYPDYRAGRTNSTQVIEKLEEKREAVEQLAQERAPGRVIAKTVGVSPETLKRHRPDLVWTKQEAAEFAATVSKLTRVKEV